MPVWGVGGGGGGRDIKKIHVEDRHTTSLPLWRFSCTSTVFQVFKADATAKEQWRRTK